MVSPNNLEKIKKEIEEFFKKMTFEAEIQSLSKEGPTLTLSLKTEEPQILIGEKGETLFEIQHLLKLILRRKINIEEAFYVDLDISDYKKKKTTYLKEMARNAAEEVVLTKKEFQMLHLFLKILSFLPIYLVQVLYND